MFDSESSPSLNETFALVRRYLYGEAPLADVVASFRALPPGNSGDVAFALPADDEIAPAAQARMDALWRALSESERAV